MAGQSVTLPSRHVKRLSPATRGSTSRRRSPDDDNDKDFTIAAEFRNDDKMADLMEHS